MDELWQRYREFWTPVLIGVGVFLVGLIVVFIMTDDPKEWQARVDTERKSLSRKVVPATKKTTALQKNAQDLQGNVEAWAGMLDQAPADAPMEYVVSSALRASILRGVDSDVLSAAVTHPGQIESRRVLERFEDDSVAAGQALARYNAVRQDRMNLLRTGDPNVGISRLLSDVRGELRVRANRADVEMPADALGFGGVASVSREVLTQRLLNIDLLARLSDLAIRSGVRAITTVRLETRANPEGEDVFLREYPATFVVRGDMDSLRPILDMLTNPAHPVPLWRLQLEHPPRTTPLEGQAQLTATVFSTLVRADATLDLDAEEGQ